jgi:hypothetical protein
MSASKTNRTERHCAQSQHHCLLGTLLPPMPLDTKIEPLEQPADEPERSVTARTAAGTAQYRHAAPQLTPSAARHRNRATSMTTGGRPAHEADSDGEHTPTHRRATARRSLAAVGVHIATGRAGTDKRQPRFKSTIPRLCRRHRGHRQTPPDTARHDSQ